MSKHCSITLIVHGRLKYTQMTLDSLIQNTDFPHELIVVNNYDNQNDIDNDVEDYLYHLFSWGKIDHLLMNKRNLGKVNANNMGWLISTGDYIATVENDILLEKGWLSKCIEYLNAVPSIGLVSPTNHDLDRFERGKTKELEAKRVVVNGKTFYLPNNNVVPGTIVARRKTIERVGLHKTSGCLYEHSCPNYCARMREAGYLAVYPSEVLAHHIDSQNIIFDKIKDKYGLTREDCEAHKAKNASLKDIKDESLMLSFPKFFG